GLRPEQVLALDADGVEQGLAHVAAPGDLLLLRRQRLFQEIDAGQSRQFADHLDEVLPPGRRLARLDPMEVLHRAAADAARRAAPAESFDIDVEPRAALAVVARAAAAPLARLLLPAVGFVGEDGVRGEVRQHLLVEEGTEIAGGGLLADLAPRLARRGTVGV